MSEVFRVGNYRNYRCSLQHVNNHQRDQVLRLNYSAAPAHCLVLIFDHLVVPEHCKERIDVERMHKLKLTAALRSALKSDDRLLMAP
mmetsp:Transcript_979/g.2025  ORF Transcript_979/g.2025 Transcript_979/m.2025 type:complete len:87 (+) Transcript_979:570-830(+)